MQRDNLNFFHSRRLNEKGQIQDILWIDARSRAAYEEFGNVVCFDNTYLTNDYDLPFINFVGVNHHGQSTLFGCALVSLEDSETISWVSPQGILTDQAAAFRKPIQETMPETRHRWCLWHILQKLPKKLGAMGSYQDFKEEFLEVVYDSLSPDAFEVCWQKVIVKYELTTNEWLTDLFQERFMWAPAYMMDSFWAGMRTTQRVGSMNCFFDQFITQHTTLCEFGEKYCAAIEKRICQERDADAKGGNWVRKLSTGFKAEREFRKLYTDAMFRKVQVECERLAYCYVREEIALPDMTIRYLLQDHIWVQPKGYSKPIVTDKQTMIGNLFNPETKEAICDCKRFETTGLLCRHVIRIFDQNLVHPVPEKYVLRRWRKDIPRKHSKINIAYHDHSKTEYVKRCDKMNVAFEALCDIAGEDLEDTEIVISVICETKKKVLERLKNRADEQATKASIPLDASEETSFVPVSDSRNDVGESTYNILDTLASASTNQSTNKCILDPPITKKRGRPQTSCYLPTGDKTKQKGKKDNDVGGKTEGKSKGKSTNKTGKGNVCVNAKGKKQALTNTQHDDGAPSKLKVTRNSRSVTFSS